MGQIDMGAVISTITSILAVLTGIVAIVVAVNNKKKDDKSDGKEQGVILTELGYIKAQNDRMLKKQEKQDEINTRFSIDIERNKDAIAACHRRLDDFEGKKHS